MKEQYSWDYVKPKEERADWERTAIEEEAAELIPLTPSQFVETSISIAVEYKHYVRQSS